VSPTGSPQSDGVLNNTVRTKIRHYRQVYEGKSDPIIFLPITVNTSGHVCDDFDRDCPSVFLHESREDSIYSILTGELPEESDQFRFVRPARLANLKDSVGLILVKTNFFNYSFSSHTSLSLCLSDT
jgi:hypothetical protein